MVEVKDMAHDEVGTLNQVADDASVLRNLIGNAEGGVQIERRGAGVRRRADAANTLRQVLGVKGVTSPQKYFKSPEESTAGLCLFDNSILNHNLNLEMAFYSGYRVNNNLCHKLSFPSTFITNLSNRFISLALSPEEQPKR